MTVQDTYYLIIPTVSAKTVIAGTLDDFNRHLDTNFTSMKDLANAVQTSIDHQQAFYIDEWAIGLISVSEDPITSDHQLTVADLIDEAL